MGSSPNRAADEANRAEQQRMASIRNTQGAVNQVFDSPQREAEIGDFMGALRERSMSDLDRQKADTDRQLRFALARGGLIGGSTQVDQQQRFGEDYSKALLGLERGVRAAGADLRGQDQSARAQLISLATSGMDTTTGAQQAAASMRSALESAKSTNLVNGIGDAFSGFKGFFEDAKEAAARRRANRESGFGPYAPMNYGGG